MIGVRFVRTGQLTGLQSFGDPGQNRESSRRGEHTTYAPQQEPPTTRP